MQLFFYYSLSDLGLISCNLQAKAGLEQIFYHKQFIFDWKTQRVRREPLKSSGITNKKAISNFSAIEKSYNIIEIQLIKAF